MAIINRDNRFNDLIKAINVSSIRKEDKKELIDYVNDVKNSRRNNDFFDDDYLQRVILEFITEGEKRNPEYTFDKVIKDCKRIFPYGSKTDDFDLLKEFFVTNINNRIYDFNIDYPYFDILFSLLHNKRDYLDIINLVNKKEYENKYKKIVDYAIDVSRFCQNQIILKHEILAFISKIDKCSDINELYDESLKWAARRSGAYDLDEEKIAVIADQIEVLNSLIKKHEAMQKQTANLERTVDQMVKSGVHQLEDFIESEKDNLVNRLNEFERDLEKALKDSSDETFRQILLDYKRQIDEFKLTAQSYSQRTTDDFLRAQKFSEEALTKLKNYLNNESKVKELLKGMHITTTAAPLDGAPQEAGNAKVGGGVILEEDNDYVDPSVSPVYIAGNPRKIIPVNNHIILPNKIDKTIIPVFDESIDFPKRMKYVEERMQEMKDGGAIFHQMAEEVIRCVMEGDWVYLWGPSGCGKSYLIKQVAKVLGIDLVENGKITEKHSVMAYNDPHGRFRATPAFLALVWGKMLSLDEFDNGNTDTQVVLNELYSGLLDVLENPDEERCVTFAEDMTVPIHPNFRMIAAGNTDGQGANELNSSRGKIDESVLERMTPKRFYYDNQVEGIILKDYAAWYRLFKVFRKVCDEYAKEHKQSTAQGIITTRDAAAIAKYVRHNSKKLENVLEEKFIQIKNKEYIEHLMAGIKREYKLNITDELNKIPDISKEEEKDGILSEYNEDALAKKFVYTCAKTIMSGRR